MERVVVEEFVIGRSLGVACDKIVHAVGRGITGKKFSTWGCCFGRIAD